MRLPQFHSQHKTAFLAFLFLQAGAPSAFASLDTVCKSSDQTLAAIRADRDQTLWVFIEQVCGVDIGKRIPISQQGHAVEADYSERSEERVVDNESFNVESPTQTPTASLNDGSNVPVSKYSSARDSVLTPVETQSVAKSTKVSKSRNALTLRNDVKEPSTLPKVNLQTANPPSETVTVAPEDHSAKVSEVSNNPRFALIGEADDWPSVELPEPIAYRPSRAKYDLRGQSYVVASNGDRVPNGLSEPTIWSMSVKFWNQQMDYGAGSFVALAGGQQDADFTARRSTATAVTPILSLSVRKGAFVGILSAMPKTSFPFTLDVNADDADRLFISDTDERSEFDLGVGWSPDSLPGFSALVGAKYVAHGPRVPGWSSKFKMNAPYLGLSYNKFVSDSTYIYLNAAGSIGGRQELKFSVADLAAAVGEDYENEGEFNLIKSKPKYLTGEIGLGRVLDNGGSISLGYRYQELKMDLTEGNQDDLGFKTIKEVGKGLTLSVGMTF